MTALQHNGGLFDGKLWGRWIGTFIGFPLAGVAARAVAGSIDSASAATLGGLAGGAVLGAVQSLALRTDAGRRVAWAAATAVGMGGGLLAGASTVGYRTDAPSLAVMGALTGIGVGFLQAAVLPSSLVRRAMWALVTPMLWALGWLVTSQVIVDAERQHANFGASGALLATVIGGLVLAAQPEATER